MYNRNEQGAALVLVLVTIVVIGIFSTVLIAQITNTTKQVSLTKKDIQTTHIAEMGMKYFRSRMVQIYNSFQSNNNHDFEAAYTYVEENVGQAFPNNEQNQFEMPLSNAKQSSKFRIHDVSFAKNIMDKKIIISYRSTGHVRDYTRTLQETIVLTLQGDSGLEELEDLDPATDESYTEHQTESECTVKQTKGNKEITYEGNQWFNCSETDTDFTSNLDNVTITGTAYFSGDVSIGNKSTIYVEGDAYIEELITFSNSSHTEK